MVCTQQPRWMTKCLRHTGCNLGHPNAEQRYQPGSHSSSGSRIQKIALRSKGCT